MKYLLYVWLALFLLLTSCRELPGSIFNEVNKTEVFIDETIIVSGTGFRTDVEYTAYIGGIWAETRVILDTEIEIKVPSGVVDGVLIISSEGQRKNVGSIKINRIYLLNNTRNAISEYSIEGRKLQEMMSIEIGDRIDEFVYSKETKELIVLYRDSNKKYTRIHSETLERSTNEIENSVYWGLATDDKGNLFIQKAGEILQLNIEDGTVLNSIGQMDNTSNLIYLPNSDEFYGYYSDLTDGYISNWNSGLDNSSGLPASSGQQEYHFKYPSAGKDDIVYASVDYQGIVQSTKKGDQPVFIFKSEDFYLAYSDYDNVNDRLVIVTQVKEGDLNPYHLIIYDIKTGSTESFQIEPHRAVLIAQ